MKPKNNTSDHLNRKRWSIWLRLGTRNGVIQDAKREPYCAVHDRNHGKGYTRMDSETRDTSALGFFYFWKVFEQFFDWENDSKTHLEKPFLYFEMGFCPKGFFLGIGPFRIF
jgi:hypothetical protein